MIRETHQVPPHTPPQRLSDYARGLFTALPSRKSVAKAIKRGEIQIDGQPAQTATCIHPGQSIELLQKTTLFPKPFPMELELVFEDDELAVLNKPPGIEVSGNRFKTIQNALTHNLRASPRPDALAIPRPIHRLDYSTSGLLLIAKTAGAQLALSQQFEQRKTVKRYRAIVQGKPPEHGSIDIPINEKSALSEYVLVETAPSLKCGCISLVDLFPQTGRTHQLRIHMAHIGHPIVGDQQYGTEGPILRGKGLFLAAVELTFLHPESARTLKIEIDMPPKFNAHLLREKRRWKKYNP
jgi:23S rRNA pseudouridine1911/1915/1917 synthase